MVKIYSYKKILFKIFIPELSYAQVTDMVYLFYTTHISVDLGHHKIIRAKVSKCGIK